jgi:hypothetical protein
VSDDTDIETEKRQADSEVAEMDSWVRSCILVGAGVCEADLDVEEWLLHSDKAFVVGAFDDKTVDGDHPHVRAYSATPSQQCGIGGVWIAWRPWVWTRGGAPPLLTFCCPAGSLRCAAAVPSQGLTLYHLRVVMIMIRSLDWLRFTYVYDALMMRRARHLLATAPQ